MNVIIGRGSEIKELEEAYDSRLAEFIAVYGRRRIGKTYLIRNFFLSKECVYFQTTGIYKAPLHSQLAKFAKNLGDCFYDGASIKVAENWMDAFEELTKAINKAPEKKKIVLFLDELPWMATRKSGMISALEYYWNRHWVNDNRIKLIACGSAASWIIKKIIKNRGGLHNRITKRMRLLPFNLHETRLYLKSIGCKFNYEQTCKMYMVIGGIPFYLAMIKKNMSIDQNIDTLLFNSESILFNEFDEIFNSLFNNSDQYVELIKLIAGSREGVQRAVLDEKNKLTGKGGRLTKRLDDLEDAGFITSYIPFGHRVRGVFYKLSDEYSYYYLKWIFPIKNQLKQNRKIKYWRNIVGTPEYFNWQGVVFENVCYKHLPQIKIALNIDESSMASPWRYIPRKDSKECGAQIDLLFDRNDKAISICEIKFTENQFIVDKVYSEQLKRKLHVFEQITQTAKQLFLSIISANGMRKSKYSDELVSSVVLLADLFVV